MAIYKRGDVYWYEFMWKGNRVRETTRQGNANLARTMENVHKASLAKGEVGLREKKEAGTLGEFIENRFEPWAKAQFEKTSPMTWKAWYRSGLRAVSKHAPLAGMPIDKVTTEDTAAFGASLHGAKLKPSSVNSRLRILRRVLRVAAEWGVIPACPKIKLLRGETHRERVITPLEEAKYLAAAPELVASVATVLFDTGLRPDECFRLRWENIRWDTGRQGTLLNAFGKTKAAHRVLPMTPRVRKLLQCRWEGAGEPAEGFVFPAPTLTGHISPSSVKKQHAAAFRAIAAHATSHNEKGVVPFVLYSIRHTFLTRLGSPGGGGGGCDVWTLARIAGHSSIVMSQRYVHPDQNSVLDAMNRLETPHKTPHSEETAKPGKGVEKLLPQ
jgi:integrase